MKNILQEKDLSLSLMNIDKKNPQENVKLIPAIFKK